MKEYIVYKGEKVIGIGTVKELAKELNMKERSVWYLTTNSQKSRNKGNRKIAFLIEDEEEE